MAGEHDHITVKLRQLSKYPNEKVLGADGVYVWEQATGILRQADVSQLPFGSGGGGGNTLLSSPFKARFGDDTVTIVPDGSGGFNTIVSDERLLGKSDYPINSSQLNNGVYRDDELIYNPTDGNVTILGLALLSGEVIVLYPQGVASGGGGGTNLQPLLDRLDELERMCAPLKPTLTGPGGGRVMFMKEASEIPIGWIEDVDMRGRFPLGFDPSTALTRPFYSIGGKFLDKIRIAQMPAHKHQSGSEALYDDYGGGSLIGNRSWASPQTYPTYRGAGTSSAGGGEDFDFTNPFRIVHWIKYVGIGG